MQTWDLALRCIQLLRRWWPLVLIAGIISGATSLLLLGQRPPQYVARTTLMVGTNLRSPNPRDNASNISLTLSSFYAEMARRTAITGRVVEQLQLPFSADILNEKLVSTRVIPQAQLIEIAVLDSDAERSARIANAIAAELIHFSPTSPDKLDEQRRFTQSQISDLEAKIEQADERLNELNAQLRQMTSAGEIAEAQQRLRELEAIKGSDQATYNGLLGNLNDSSVNTVSVFEAAQTPTEQVPQRTFPAVVLSIMLGIIIGLGAAWVLDDLDDKWSRSRNPAELLGERMLGAVATDWGDLVSAAALNTPRGKQGLALRSEVLMGLGLKSRTTVLITSAHSSPQRSRLSADLARLLAQSGQHVLLVDANLSGVSIARTFNVEGDGLQQLLYEPNTPLSQLAHPTEQVNLAVLPGTSERADATLIPTFRWPDVVLAVECDTDIELTVFDGPAVLEGADATLLAPHIGGIVLVVDPTLERVSETRQTVQRLHEAGAPLLGLVLLTTRPQRGWQDLRRRLLRPRADAATSATS